MDFVHACASDVFTSDYFCGYPIGVSYRTTSDEVYGLTNPIMQLQSLASRGDGNLLISTQAFYGCSSELRGPLHGGRMNYTRNSVLNQTLDLRQQLDNPAARVILVMACCAGTLGNAVQSLSLQYLNGTVRVLGSGRDCSTNTQWIRIPRPYIFAGLITQSPVNGESVGGSSGGVQRVAVFGVRE